MDVALAGPGVNTVAIPRRGRPGAARQNIQRAKRFTKLVKWRTGSEGRISCLKRGYGWGRTLLDGLNGATTWCGWGVLAHNSVKVSALIETEDEPTPHPAPVPTRSPRARTASTGPPPGPPPASPAA